MAEGLDKYRQPSEIFAQVAEPRCTLTEFYGIAGNNAKKHKMKLVLSSYLLQACPRGVVGKVMDCRLVINDFELQSRYYVHFHTNTVGKGMKPFILPAIG